MSEPVILLIEGERVGEESLAPALVKDGYQLRIFHTGNEALHWISKQSPDLVVFDAASMRSNGVHSCRRIRQRLAETPIIHTRRTGEKDDSAGADIYLKKPFTWRKVLNRVRALLPADQFRTEIVRAGKLTLIRSKPSVDIDGQGETQLTPKQAHLLEVFLRHPNRVLTRRELMRTVWQTDYVGDTRTLDVHIRWVREAIEDDPATPRRIETVRGVGYIFRMPPTT